jgi:hypothetical protein
MIFNNNSRDQRRPAAALVQLFGNLLVIQPLFHLHPITFPNLKTLRSEACTVQPAPFYVMNLPPSARKLSLAHQSNAMQLPRRIVILDIDS